MALVLKAPISPDTVRYGRFLTGTALFLIASAQGLSLVGLGGITTRATLDVEVMSFIRAIVLVALFRFIAGVGLAMLKLRLDWFAFTNQRHTHEFEARKLPPLEKSAHEQLKFLNERQWPSSIAATGVIFAAVRMLVDVVAPPVFALYAFVYSS